jgi:hypothetical protein
VIDFQSNVERRDPGCSITLRADAGRPTAGCRLVLREPSEQSSLSPVLCWQSPDRPVPVRAVRLPSGARPPAVGLEAPPWLSTGPVGQPFDFCGHVRRLCADMVRHCPELAHIDVSRILFAMTQARSPRSNGLQARVTPLRFQGGSLTCRRPDGRFQIQRYVVDDREMLYLVTFCLPRFLDRDFADKFVTLFHELYHISPAFEGDLRREGRYALHAHGKKEYDRHMAHLARAYLANGADRSCHDFLRLNFAQLAHRHGKVHAVVVPRPRLIRLGPPTGRDASTEEE